MHKSLFITFEGTDGSGKTTQIEMLIDYFKNTDRKFIFCREPGGTEISEKIRNLIIDRDNKMSPYTEALLYAAARAELTNTIIKPNLEKGNIVICDRFLDSSLIYQGIARGLGIEEVENINLFATKGLQPDITFFMDISPVISLERRKENSEPDRIELEKMDFHKKVYNGYLELAKKYPNRIHKIDANREPLIIHNNIIQILKTNYYF